MNSHKRVSIQESSISQMWRAEKKCTFWYPWLQTRRIQSVARISVASCFAFNLSYLGLNVHFSAGICPLLPWRNTGRPATVSQGKQDKQCYVNRMTVVELLNANN